MVGMKRIPPYKELYRGYILCYRFESALNKRSEYSNEPEIISDCSVKSKKDTCTSQELKSDEIVRNLP